MADPAPKDRKPKTCPECNAILGKEPHTVDRKGKRCSEAD